ncbi:mitochondrial small ribosomal subunit protein uS17m [Candidatus Dojkabacteria bacterium]|uniref:30S ribosomal protein S17 n=1 Tax=Candidatus Dojkabacteria bacterium TaxID=2099670 RepID=A0A955L2B9_9BACT|nr:mitochondrial small ribosomal subunit protein uS17m [Candidatus Dojkabacteria bacterium]
MAKENKATKKESMKRMMDAIVVSVLDTKTAKVRVETKFAHPKYGKIIKSHKSYLVNKSDDMELVAGDAVTIGEIRPLSRKKTWEVINKVENKK